MASELLLPLFPLEVVLLPGSRLPLHIFEPRYKLMIGEAIRDQSEFGIVLAKDNSLVNVGCTASVEEVARRYPDGRMDILAVGRRRFEILFLDEQKEYLRGAVHFFEDDPSAKPNAEALQDLAEQFRRLAGLLPAAEAIKPDPDQPSFSIAAVLPPDLELRQRLLSSRSEAERVTLLGEHLEALLPRLEMTRRVERSARGNGQGR